MGGITVLHPQDCLRKHDQVPISSLMKPPRIPNPNPKKSNQSPDRNNSNSEMADRKNLVMERVKILKRGEELTVLKNRESGIREKRVKEKAAVEDSDDLVLSSKGRLGPEPELVPFRDFYAGSAFIESPLPSSLPLPAFFVKKSGQLPDFFLE